MNVEVWKALPYMEQLKYLHSVLTSYLDYEEVQIWEDGTWKDCKQPEFSAAYFYRVKPKSKLSFKPYKEADPDWVGSRVICLHDNNMVRLITGVDIRDNTVEIEDTMWTMEEFLRLFKWYDIKRPCGIKED